MKRLLFCVVMLCAALYSSGAVESAPPAGLIHPGILHTQADMDNLYRLVEDKTELAFGSFLLLKAHECAQADYRMKCPFPVISRDGEYGHTKSAMEAGIYFDNREMYGKARDFYLHASDNGTIAHYVDGETGQIQESDRDQPGFGTFLFNTVEKIAAGSEHAAFHLPPDAADVVWQWAADVPASPYTRGASRAYLWIHEECRQVNAVVFAQHNMEEIQIMQDAGFREALGEMGIAQVWCSPAWDLMFHFNEGAGDIFLQIMNGLAEKSGYVELRHVPVIYMGHSAAASAPYYFAAWNPERTLAAISVSGQWPYVRNEFAPDIWGDRNIDYIPCLETMGEYENAVNWSATGLKDKAAHPLTPLSMLACPAEGHFASTPEKAAFIAFYIQKAMQYRMPEKPDRDGNVALRPIDPLKTGWLADKWRGDTPPTAEPAPVAGYKGNPEEAFWFFDREHAMRTQEYQSRHRNMKVQLLGYEQNGHVVPQKNIHLQVPLAFLPEDDGVSFVLNGVFMDTVPRGSPRPARWAGQPAGTAVGHSESEERIAIDVICGPMKKVSGNRFMLDFGRNEIRNARYTVALAATHPGDSVYKPMVQQAELIFPEKLTEGRPQTLTFPEITDVRYDALVPVVLEATSDAGLPVYYYVTEGPAVVEGNRLTFTPLPPRARFPVAVRVEAWQYGSKAKGVQTAETVARTFYIVK